MSGLHSVPHQPPDHTAVEPNMPVSQQASTGENIRYSRKQRNIFAIIKDMRKRHKRKKPLKDAPGVRQSIIAIFKASWLNVLLVFIPLSWIFHFLKLNDILIFVFSFLAIVPLAKLRDLVADELSMRLGQTPAGLLNTTLGNAVELIVAIIALLKCELIVVQSSLIGSILSNLLLAVGMCFFAGGTRFSEQGFGISALHLNSSLLTLSVIAVLLPAAYHNVVQASDSHPDPLTDAQEGHRILTISHSVAVILLFIYLCYLVFQLFSHKNFYTDNHSDVQESVAYPPKLVKRLHINQRRNSAAGLRRPSNDAIEPGSSQRDVRSVEAGPEEDDAEEPQMGLQTAIALLAVIAVVVSVTAEFLVDSIDGLTQTGHISKGFVGLILLPNIGNAAEHVAAVTVSVKNELTLSLGAAVGSSIQIALFVIPFTVILGWIMNKPLTLLFDPFLSIVLFLSVFTVSHVVRNGKSNWLKGMILMCLYVIIAVTFWFYPVSYPARILTTCK